MRLFRSITEIIYKVEGDAQRMLTEAEGYAVERVNNAKGDANLYESILVEYMKNPQITKDRLYIETMEYVMSKNKNKIIVDKDIENLVPLLDQSKFKKLNEKRNLYKNIITWNFDVGSKFILYNK